ncbi:MAG: hypothetical protein RLZZ385_1242 [Pseudomonadota bacterium]|jgi:hypothetical protein
MKAKSLSILVTLSLTVATGVFVLGSSRAAESAVPYPEDYRGWHHVKSMVIEAGHPLFGAFGGIHHIYANERALSGYRSERFPDGSVIVFDLLESLQDGNAITEGQRKVLGVMHKDSRRFADTGGWGFEGFGGGDPGNRVVGDSAASACFACHQPQAVQDFTFSRLRD